MSNIIRQGDVIFRKLEAPPASNKELSEDASGILAEGESSGHHHRLYGRGAKLFRFKSSPGRMLVRVAEGGAEVRVDGGGSAAHPRHTPVSLSPGVWEAWTQRSWTSGAVRRVAD